MSDSNEVTKVDKKAARAERKAQKQRINASRSLRRKMIKFAQDGVRTGLDQIYDGNARQQFEAVWHYLLRLNKVEQGD